MKVLMTGFNPFDGESLNPSWEVVKNLPEETNGIYLIKRELPTEFLRAQKILEEEILKNKPEIVLSVGQARGRGGIHLEKVAINLMEARIPDNTGFQPKNVEIEKEGPTAFFTNLPIEKFKSKLEKRNIPAHISYTAGTYVCNTVFYKARFLAEEKDLDFKSGFIHMPFLPEQVIGKKENTPFMTHEMMSEALEIIIKNL